MPVFAVAIAGDNALMMDPEATEQCEEERKKAIDGGHRVSPE
jgi:hypothetical protein